MLENLIYSRKKREQITDILTMEHPTHNQRLYILGFFKNVIRLNDDDIFNLIKRYNNWDDFSISKTEKQVYGTNPYSNPKTYTWDKNHDICKDSTIFSKLNNSFFKDTLKTAWEYEPGMYNIHKNMSWEVTKHPVYRITENKNHTLMLCVDIDGEDIDLCWDTAKHIANVDNWSHIKFSGRRGFHLVKPTKHNSYLELADELYDIYDSVKTNLVSFTTVKENIKAVNIDPTLSYRNKMIRGYCINLKSNKYSIPVNTDMSVNDIVNMSDDLTKVKEYLQNNY